MEAHHTVQALIFGSYSASFGSKGDQTTELAACKTLGFARLGGSELSLPASGLLGLVCEGISLTT